MSARVIRPEEVPAEQSSRENGTIGNLTVHRIHDALGTDQVRMNVIFFEPGARFRPHKHPYDQVLHYVSGTGVVALDGGEDQVVQEGEFVLLPAGVPHMHGAAPGTAAVHVSTMRVAEPGLDVSDFSCEIPDSWSHFRE
jgi:quercetin dioxygenase-like cupin family protein